MKRKVWLAGLAIALGSVGCSGMSTTDKGLLTGGALGGLIGTGIGAATGNAGVGALVGTGLGAATGAVVGNDIERTERRQAAVAAARPAPMGMQDVVYMAQQHVGDDTILRQIETTGSSFNLTAQDVVFLRQQGVSERVIGFMQARRPVVPAGRTVYVVEPPPPPVSVGFGVGFGSRGRRGCW